jgi:hypothetical protein
MIEVYRKYKNKGFACLPTQSDKSPAVPKGTTWKGGITDEKMYTSYGIGILCGKISDGLECFDFDNKFGDAKQILSEFIAIDKVKEIYEKYKLPIESTMSGGYHLLFRCDEYGGNLKLASRGKLDDETGKMKPVAVIETRGDGGYFVCAPTPKYEVIRNDIFNIQHIEPEERKTLFSVARSFNQWVEIRSNEFEIGNKPGDIYNQKSESVTEMKSALMASGWVEVSKFNWRRPGKKEGISATIGKVADNVFYCFSSSAHPFNEMSGYTPFQVVGLLKYNGDFSKLAKDLSERYGLNEYQNTKVQYSKPQVKRKTEDELNEIIKKSFIDVNIPIAKPPVILEINHGDELSNLYKRLITLGNISSITGKGKSKKTFLQSIMLACFAINDKFQFKFRATLPDNKRQLLQFDTEQGEYDTYLVARRIHDMAGGYQQHLGTFNLREYEPFDRIDIIFKAIDFYKNNLGFVAIDGIADLVNDINDVQESVKITSMLLACTKKYNIHISNIIHQNKNDNYATGHLGSSLIKKSEVVIGVDKDEDMKYRSIVSCQNIRGAEDFEDFAFQIDINGIPRIDWDWKRIEKKSWVK